MEKKAKIIATLGPAIYSNAKLKQLVKLGVDAFRINFSHNTDRINKIVSKIRKIERYTNKKVALIADLQGFQGLQEKKTLWHFVAPNELAGIGFSCHTKQSR